MTRHGETLMNSKLVLPAGVCALLSLAAAAQERLDIRTGTWEITATTHMSGTPLSNEMLSKMTPEQRAEVQAAMREEAAKGPQTEVTRECITQQEVERPFASADLDDCTQQIVRTTRTTQEARLHCTGEHNGSGLRKVTAPNPQTMTATLELSAGDGPTPFTIRSQMKGRWLAAACEDEDAYDDSNEEDASAPDEYDEPEDEQ
jgi:Protein of unknown function (DUF3617)